MLLLFWYQSPMESVEHQGFHKLSQKDEMSTLVFGLISQTAYRKRSILCHLLQVFTASRFTDIASTGSRTFTQSLLADSITTSLFQQPQIR